MKYLNKKLALLLCAVVMMMGIVACGKTNNNVSETQTPEVTVQNQGVTYPLTVYDSEGTEIRIEQEPKRVVSVAPNLTEIVCKLGAFDKLVGRTDYCDYPSEVSTVESIGTLYEPNVEKIISLEPELVIASTHFQRETAEKLNEAGIPVLVLILEDEVSDVYTMIDTLGKALNRTEEAKATVEDMKNEIAKVEEAIKGEEPKTVYYVVGYGEGGDFTATGDTFVNQMLTMAGGKNIAADATGWSYSLEKLLENDPEYIIVGKGEKEAFVNTATYQELTAVKEDKVYEIDRNLIDREGYRNAEGISKLAKIMHPNKVK